MAAFLNFFKKFKIKDDDSKKKKINSCIKKDCNPSEFWENICELGDGAFGKVYKAEHKTTQQIAAVKQITLDSEEDLEDSMVEIEILNDCKHNNIIQLYEVYLFNSVLYMYIEFCGAGAIDSIMLELDKPLNEPQIRYVCHQISHALSFLHEHHVIHRDMKAGNVLLTIQGEVKLADFGVSAKNQSEKQRRDSFIGTPYWMAPEVMACETFKDNPYDNRADVWSLGITLIEFAQMHPPNHEMNAMRVLIKIQKGDPPELDSPQHWSKEFNLFLKRCLVKNPNDRATVSDLLQDPFIKQVTENDLKSVYALVCEFKADVIEDIVEGSVRDSMYSILDTADAESDSTSLVKHDAIKAEDSVSEQLSVEDSSTQNSTDLLIKKDELDLDKTAHDDTLQMDHNKEDIQDTSPEQTIHLQDDLKEPQKEVDEAGSAEEEDTISSQLIEQFVNDIIDKAARSLRKSQTQTDEAETSTTMDVRETSPAVQEDATAPASDVQDNKISNQVTEEGNKDTTDNKNLEETVDQKKPLITPAGEPCSSGELKTGSSTFYAASHENDLALRRQSYMMATDDGDEEPDSDCIPDTTKTIDKDIPDTILEEEETGTKSDRIVMRPERRKSCYRTINRTRKFVVDGKEITTKTTRVVRDDENTVNEEQRRLQQRQDFREMKIIAKEEKRQDRDFQARCDQAKEQLLQKLKAEEVVLQRNCDTDLDVLEREKKQLIDKAEAHNEAEIKHMLRRMKAENAKTERRFRENHETEQNLLKAEIEVYPKDQRKEKFKEKKEILDLEFAEKLNSLKEDNEKKLRDEQESMKRRHRKQIKEIELDVLKRKQEKLKAYEDKRWQMTIAHCQQRFQLEKHQLKDYFNLKRNQTARRLEREAQQLNAVIAREMSDLHIAHQQERKQMPKRLKILYKTRLIMKKESLRIKNDSHLSLDAENKILKEFEESEKERMRMESENLEQRLKRGVDDLAKQHEQRRKELSQLQAEKKKDLIDIETDRTAALENKSKSELSRLKEMRTSRIQEMDRQQVKERTDLETYFLNEECIKLTSASDHHITNSSKQKRSNSNTSRDQESILSNMSTSSCGSHTNGNSLFYYSQSNEANTSHPNVTLNESDDDKLI